MSGLDDHSRFKCFEKQEQPTVPEGMVLVPKEPTPTMLDAGFNATSADGFTKQSAAWVYRAMIDAARGE